MERRGPGIHYPAKIADIDDCKCLRSVVLASFFAEKIRIFIVDDHQMFPRVSVNGG